jgi:hypothetical protein
MSAPGADALPAPQLKSPRLREFVAFASAFSRPFMTYAGTITVCTGAIKLNTVEGYLVAAGLAGVYGVARSFDKATEAKTRGS